MMQENNDSILAFEYFTASGKKDKCIISEAEALIFSLLDDLKDFNIDLVITSVIILGILSVLMYFVVSKLDHLTKKRKS